MSEVSSSSSNHLRDGAPRANPRYHSKRPFGANIPHQRTNSSTGKPVVLLVLGLKRNAPAKRGVVCKENVK